MQQVRGFAVSPTTLRECHRTISSGVDFRKQPRVLTGTAKTKRKNHEYIPKTYINDRELRKKTTWTPVSSTWKNFHVL